MTTPAPWWTCDHTSNSLPDCPVCNFDLRRYPIEALIGAQNEIGSLQAERGRLARILAVERGDESAAPEGWRWNQHARHWFRHDCGEVLYRDTGTGWWHRMSMGALLPTHHGIALEAMEAADLARKGGIDAG